MNNWMDKMEDQLVADLNAGRIDRETFNREMRELQREVQAAAREAAQDAYDRELERW